MARLPPSKANLGAATKSAFQNGDQAVIWSAPAAASALLPLLRGVCRCMLAIFLAKKLCMVCNISPKMQTTNVTEDDLLLKLIL